MLQARKWIAVAMVAGLAAWLIYVVLSTYNPRLVDLYMIVASAALAATAFGLAAERWWSRPLGLAAGITSSLCAVLGVALARVPYFAPSFLGPLVIACLAGSRMRQLYEGGGLREDGTARLLRWTLITNITGLSFLLMGSSFFLSDRGFQLDAFFLTFLSAGLVLLPGLALLGRQKTAGLLLVAAASVVQCAALAWLFAFAILDGLWAPALICTAILLPGVFTSVSLTCVYARPMWRLLRG